MLSRPPAAVSHQGITSQSDENGFDKSDPLQSDTYRINIDSAAQTGLVNWSKASAQTRFSGQHWLLKLDLQRSISPLACNFTVTLPQSSDVFSGGLGLRAITQP